MSIDDKVKWEKKYKSDKNLLEKRPASHKYDIVLKLLDGGKVLDLACGAGRNTVFLSKKGFYVDAYDISLTALNNIDSMNLDNVNTYEFDLDEYNPKNLDYDLVVMTNFLDRLLIKKVSTQMKINSYFFIETYMNHEINEKKNSNPDFLLAKNELKEFFNNDKFEILDYDEFENESYESFKMMKQSILVKKLKV